MITATAMSPSMRQFRTALEERGLTPDTVDAYSHDVARFIRENVLEVIDEDTFTDLFYKWIEGRKEQVSASTVSRQSGALRLYAAEVYGLDVDAPDLPRRESRPHDPVAPTRNVMLPGLIDPGTTDWQKQSMCVGKLDIMFSNKPQGRAEAKAICATCPVTEQCLDYALRNKLDTGTWGGMTEDERRKLR